MVASQTGTRIAQLRGSRSQTDLAKALRGRGFKVTQASVSRWESGLRPPAAVLPALAAELGVTVADLYAPPTATDPVRFLEDLHRELGVFLGKNEAAA